MNILFICPRIPVPPIKGDKLRAFYQIKGLSQRHNVTMLTFSESSDSAENQRLLQASCERMLIIPRVKHDILLSLSAHLFTDLPLQCAYYHSGAMRRYSRIEISKRGYDIIHIQLARMMSYAPPYRHIPVVVDFVDTLSLNMRRRLDRDRLFFQPFFFHEWYKMKKYEKQLDKHFDGAMISSPIDKTSLPYGNKVDVIPNGVDLDHFHYFSHLGREPHTIIFTGNMGYFPNVDAVTHFCRQVYPKIKLRIPDVKFKIVGSSPKAVVSRLSHLDKNIEITGFVNDIATELGKATVAVAPMLSGSGMQFKILEAMATGTPVVATRLATRAIEVKPNVNILIAESPTEFAQKVVDLLTNPAMRHSIGMDGRRLVEDNYSWDIVVKRLESVYQKTMESYKRK